MRYFLLLFLIIGSSWTASQAAQADAKQQGLAATAAETSMERQLANEDEPTTKLKKRGANEERVLVAPTAQYFIRSASPKLLQHYTNENGVIVSASPHFGRQAQSARQYELDGYRPGQVISIDPRHLESDAAQKQYVIATQPLYEEGVRPLPLQPSRTLIARPQATLGRDDAVAHVGAALSVSDRPPTSESFAPRLNPDLYSLLAQPQTNKVQQAYARPTVAPKAVAAKHRSKSHFPQQYLIETTPQENVRQQVHPQYVQLAPASASKYVQQNGYRASPEYQPAKPLQQSKYQLVRVPMNYRSQSALQPYRVQSEDKRPSNVKYAHQMRSANLAAISERPVTVLKTRQEKLRIQKPSERVRYSMSDPTIQIIDNQYYLRPVYRPSEQAGKMQLSHLDFGATNLDRMLETTTQPALAHSAIYVNKVTGNSKKEPALQNIQIEQHGESLEEQRSILPPPKNNKAYTPEEFRALIAAGYSVTPVPVGVDETGLPDFLTTSRSDSVIEKRQERRKGRRPPYGSRNQNRAPIYLLDIPRAGADM